MGLATPPPQGTQRSPILGFPSIYMYTLWRSITKFDVVTRMMRGLFMGQICPRPKGAEPPRSPIFGVLLYTTTPFDTERPNSAWKHIWDLMCFRRSITPSHLHKCVARFISDSWVLSFLFILPVSRNSTQIASAFGVAPKEMCFWDITFKLQL